jgi:hypothetical protein
MELVKNISGKKILFIGPRFFNYQNDIIKSLINFGADVDYVPDRPYDMPIMKAIIRYRRELVEIGTDNYYKNKIKYFSSKKYKYIFIIQGECLNPKLLRLMRDTFINAKFILYLWDSLKNKPSLVNNLRFFDECFTFDKLDQKNYTLKYRPLFYVKDYARNNNIKNHKYNLSFIGTAHSDRYKIIKEIKKYIPADKVFYQHLYLQAKWMFYYHKIFNKSFYNASYNEFNYTSLRRDKVSDIFFESLAVLDIEHTNQNGLTMRTFEAIGARKKLLTTNSSIIHTDIYNPNNICVLDRDDISIPKLFFDTPYQNLSKSIYNKYSIDGWLNEILN